jgi:hypothetical protein
VRLYKSAVVLLVVAACVSISRVAEADSEGGDASTTSAAPLRPHFVGDLRLMYFLSRSDNNYFAHASAYSYSIGPDPGIQLNVGVELLPRWSLVGSAHYSIEGADRDSAQLRLQSGAILALARWSVFRVSDAAARVDVALQGGFGRYVIKETYLDPAISPQTYEKDDGAWGGTVGVQGSLTLSAFLAVLGYGFHYAPATIADRIGGTVQAGGHEMSIGVGVWL